MDARFYVLNGQTPVLTDNIWTWLAWFLSTNRVVAFTPLLTGEVVSTIFLGVNDAPEPSDPPLLFQTLVRGGSLDTMQRQYATWQAAEAGHKRIVAEVRGARYRRPAPRLFAAETVGFK